MVFNFPKWHSLNRNNSRGYFKWHKSKRKLAQFDRNQWHKYSENTGTNRTKIAIYNKNVIFTGNLKQISRKEAAEIIFSMGAEIKTTISKKIQIVIIGTNPGPAKLKQIEYVISKGTDITILNEEDFLSKIK